MQGHHVYTRGWFEHGSTTRSPGTFTVEIDGFSDDKQKESRVIHALGDVYSRLAESHMDEDGALLQVLQPVEGVLAVGLTRFVGDQLTQRGLVQYTYTRLFMDDNSGLDYSSALNDLSRVVLCVPFERYYERYEDFVKRHNAEGRVLQKKPERFILAKTDENPNVAQTLQMVFKGDQILFTEFFSKLLYALYNSNSRLILSNFPLRSRELMVLCCTITPAWAKGNFNAVSHWLGGYDGLADSIRFICRKGNADQKIGINLLRNNAVSAKTPKDADFLAQIYWSAYAENRGSASAFEKSVADYLLLDRSKMPPELAFRCYELFAERKKTETDAILRRINTYALLTQWAAKPNVLANIENEIHKACNAFAYIANNASKENIRSFFNIITFPILREEERNNCFKMVFDKLFAQYESDISNVQDKQVINGNLDAFYECCESLFERDSNSEIILNKVVFERVISADKSMRTSAFRKLLGKITLQKLRKLDETNGGGADDGLFGYYWSILDDRLKDSFIRDLRKAKKLNTFAKYCPDVVSHLSQKIDSVMATWFPKITDEGIISFTDSYGLNAIVTSLEELRELGHNVDDKLVNIFKLLSEQFHCFAGQMELDEFTILKNAMDRLERLSHGKGISDVELKNCIRLIHLADTNEVTINWFRTNSEKSEYDVSRSDVLISRFDYLRSKNMNTTHQNRLALICAVLEHNPLEVASLAKLYLKRCADPHNETMLIDALEWGYNAREGYKYAQNQGDKLDEREFIYQSVREELLQFVKYNASREPTKLRSLAKTYRAFADRSQEFREIKTLGESIRRALENETNDDEILLCFAKPRQNSTQPQSTNAASTSREKSVLRFLFHVTFYVVMVSELGLALLFMCYPKPFFAVQFSELLWENAWLASVILICSILSTALYVWDTFMREPFHPLAINQTSKNVPDREVQTELDTAVNQTWDSYDTKHETKHQSVDDNYRHYHNVEVEESSVSYGNTNTSSQMEEEEDSTSISHENSSRIMPTDEEIAPLPMVTTEIKAKSNASQVEDIDE